MSESPSAPDEAWESWDASGAKVVEIHGLQRMVTVQEGSASLRGKSVFANGKKGRAYLDGAGQYVTETFDGLFLHIPEENLRSYSPGEPEEGGFDAMWPTESGSCEAFGELVADIIRVKGYCVIQMFESDEMRAGLLQVARRRTDYTLPRREFEEAYLGQEHASKVAWLGGMTLAQGPGPDPLARYDRRLRDLCGALAPVCDILGFRPWENRSGTMLRRPLESNAELDMLRWEPLDDQDVEYGHVESHLDFVQRRRLCMMYLVDNQGGTMELCPAGASGMQAVRLPLRKDRLLVFRHDLMTYSYQPTGGDDLVLQSWLMEEPTLLRIDSFQGTQQSMEAVLAGSGPPQHPDEQVHVMDANTRFPGKGYQKERAWLVWSQQTDAFVDIPLYRWDHSQYWTGSGELGKCACRHLCLLGDDELIGFDNKYFGISDMVAAGLYPMHRALLENITELMHMVGFTSQTLRGALMGMYVADIGMDYDLWHGYHYAPEAWAEAATSHAFGIASRLAFQFGVIGPVHQVDTACSSSLVGTNLLHAQLRYTEKGVKMGCSNGNMGYFQPFGMIGLSVAGMLGPTGRCQTFDNRANGYARGEGCAGLFLKVSDDLRDTQDRMADYVGSYINQDGRSASLTAPNGPSQQSVMRGSMRQCGLQPEDLALQENHGTGTALGDPIEVGSIRAVFRKRSEPIGITSGKTHMGHLEACAGIVGMLKSILAATFMATPANCHLHSLNAHIENDGFPAFFPNECASIVKEHAMVGVNGFGFGGTNTRCDMWAHCRYGSYAVGMRKLEIKKLAYVAVECPRCLGLMCYLCGAAVPPSTAVSKHHCADVRDEFASYSHCSLCYAGGYRCGGPVCSGTVDHGQGVYLAGTWNAWSTFEEMDRIGLSSYVGRVVLGETRRERFCLVLDKDFRKAIFPVAANAHRTARILGPDRHGNSWQIDGCRDGVPVGTVYRVVFEWDGGLKSITWEPLGVLPPEELGHAGYQHKYSVCGSLAGGGAADMAAKPDTPGLWEFVGKIGARLSETFHIVRDDDRTQVIYPLETHPASASVPVMGPSEGGERNYWHAWGDAGELVTVRLRIEDGDITVTATANTMGETSWQSAPGGHRDVYYAVGTWTGWKLEVPMTSMPAAYGVHSSRFTLGSSGVEQFQIVVNRNMESRLYPSVGGSAPGRAAARGPDGAGASLAWEVAGPPGLAMEVILDAGAEDRRHVVTCRALGIGADAM